VSPIANRRELIEAAQALAKTNAPDKEHYLRVTLALANVYSDDIGAPGECILRKKNREGGSNA